MDRSTFIVAMGILFLTGYYLATPQTYQLQGAMLILFVIDLAVIIKGLYENYKGKGRLI